MSGPSARHWEQNKEATVYVGNIHEDVTQQLLTELMNHHGRVRTINMPVDRVNGKHQGFGFVEFATESDAEYVISILNGTRLYGTAIRMNKASADKQKNVEVGAELFIGNLDAMVDEKALYDTFSRFGQLANVPKVARDEFNISKGYGFVSYADFDASDNAITHMHGQYMMNKQISVQYAYKKDGKGERHGDEAERMLAKQAKAHGVAPVVQALPAHLFQAAPAPAPLPGRGVPGAPNGPAGYGGGMPPRGPPVPASLPPPPSGLPARPPSGAPANFYPPPTGFGAPGGPPPPGFHPPPPGFNGPPPGFTGNR
ncbi:RNA-binding domain-containing protein [Lentithecium fluviatile CBS 122367]|uniref:RNA-binding domain-containing protein n=1 Tax=Lentithecium fluviatile CBS 122367 TaxID=1168545 RepID=A0A6G1IRU0_9PLEO|nr:RNA-binding domain-containing protein [Lentithecium fluviatile CBS 122367]